MRKIISLTVGIFIIGNVFASSHTVIATGTNPTCNGACNGTASANASGGIGPYGYTWDGPASFNASGQSISGLCTGSYTVTAIDSSDMSVAMDTLNLYQPLSLSTTAVNGGPVCTGFSTLVQATSSGGTPTYIYSWSPSAGLSNPNVYNPTATPASTTTYTITVTDAQGCTANQSTTVVVNPNPVVTVNSVTICPGQTAILTASGATTYSWTPSGSTTNPHSVTPATTTSYTVTGTTSGCSSYATAVVTVSPVPSIVLNSYNAHCGMCDGAISNSTTGATTYSWAGPSGYNSTISNPNSLCPGTYTLTAIGATGCSSNSTATINNVPGPTVTIGSIVNSTCGASNGSMNALASGGSSPYTYSWAPSGNTTASLFGLAGGTYTVTITDANGCSATASATVISLSGVSNLTVTPTDANCGTNNGSVTYSSPVGGTGPYSYSFNGGAFNATTFQNGLAAGTYAVVVQDANGCTYSTNTTVLNIGGPSSCNITTVGSSCSSSTGQINIDTMTIAGGTWPYTFSIDGGAFGTTVNFTGLAVGVHSISIKDVNGCILTQNVTVNTQSPPVIVLDSTNNISCTGSILGNVFISVSGGTPGYNYLWSNGSVTEDLLNISSIGSYTVSVTDLSGCSATQSFVINNAFTLYASIATVNGNCGTLGSATIYPAGGVPPYTCSWNTIPVQTTTTVSGLANGNYNCTVTDANGCARVFYTNIHNNCINIIKGNLYVDANSNCIKDAGELPLSWKTVLASGSGGVYYGYSDVNGNYTIQTPNMNNTVSVAVLSSLSSTCPATGSLTVNFSTPGDTLLNNDFGYYNNPSFFDLGIHPGWTSGSPGFTKNYWIYTSNNSGTTQNMMVRFVYDSNLVYTSCTLGGTHFPSQHKIEWTFTGVPAYMHWTPPYKPAIYFNVPNTLTTSSTLCSYFEILPISGDSYPSDNTLSSCEPITSCHDPNSKSVVPKGQGPNGDIFATDSVLLYTIHFQNNGNDTAHFVIVKDTLSPFLDPSTIVPGASDHPYTFNLSEQGIMTFTFDNIMLPDSAADEPASNGYFNYTIKQKSNNPVGTVITNSAAIYFDYNLPVITNSTINTIVDLATNVETMSTNEVVKVYPNPFTDNTMFVIQSDQQNLMYSFEMTDVLGKKVNTMNNISEKQFSVSRNGLQNGIYFYKIYSAEKIIGIGKVIIK